MAAGPRDRRRPRRLALAVALALASPLAFARETLLLDLSVNGRKLEGVVVAEATDDGRVLLPASAWQSTRLRAPAASESLSDGTPAVALDAVPGLHWTLDRNGLRLDLQAPSEAFERTTLSLREAGRAAPARPARGVYVDYDAFAGWDDAGHADAGLLAEFVAFGPAGSLVHDQAWRRDAGGSRAIRLETFFQRDLPGRMETLVFGDAISSAGGWSRPARYAGLRYARDFATAPGFVSWPVPTLSGSAALPSTVDLLVNQRRQSQQDVPAGPFDLGDVPLGNGAGDLQLVVRDVLGRETVVQQSYYVATSLLSPGLTDFSHEAGWLRRGFGSDEDRYTDGFVASSLRVGVSEWLTVGGRAEWQRDRQAAGLQASARIGTLGVAGVSVASSWTDGVQGLRTEWSAQRISRGGGFGLRWMQAQAGFREFGALDDEPRTRRELQLSFGHRLGPRASFGLQAVQRDRWDGERFRLLGASLSFELPRGHLSIDASRRIDDGGWAGMLRLSLPLGARRSAQASVSARPSGATDARVELRQGLPAGRGWGWRLAAGSEDSQRVEADLLRRHDAGEWSLAARLGPGRAAFRAGARGAVGRVAGTDFASRSINRGAFAIVEVGGLPDVPVMLSHQPVAHTNAQGRAVVTGLLPYQLNRLSIDPARLPLDAQVGADRAELVPYARGGTRYAFPVTRSREDWLVLRTEDGQPVPEGARLSLGPGLAEFSIARRGEAWVSGLQGDRTLEVRWRDGACRVRIEGRLLAAPGARNAPMLCSREPQ